MPHHCNPCDRYFGTQQSLQQHLNSRAHDFDCNKCERSFATKQALEQHSSSPAHAFDCKECGRKFGTQSSLQQHRKSPAHVPRAVVEYLGHPRSEVTPVFAAAKRLRYREPTVDDILRQVKTELEHPIVAALIAAALRLLPVDNTPQGVKLRIEKHRVKAFESKLAEDGFCAKLTRLGYEFLREHEQEGETSTPDIRFTEPIFVYGHLCWWLEYKNYFGFRDNPFVTRKNKRQFQKYATQIGQGAVIYNLGFETGYMDINGVTFFREKEVVQHLEIR